MQKECTLLEAVASENTSQNNSFIYCPLLSNVRSSQIFGIGTKDIYLTIYLQVLLNYYNKRLNSNLAEPNLKQ